MHPRLVFCSIRTTTSCVPQRRMCSDVAPRRGIEVTLPQAAFLAGSVSVYHSVACISFIQALSQLYTSHGVVPRGGTHTPILRNRGAFTLETLTPNKLFTSFINYTSSKVFGLLVFSKHLSA